MYVFCDVNCQPMIKLKSGSFLRFDTYEQGMSLLGLVDNDADNVTCECALDADLAS